MEMKRHSISICIPSYNSEEFIKMTIESVLNQTYEEWELFISDDGSTDATLDIIKTFLSDPRIHLHENQTNVGLEANWNRALSMARGEYVKMLCADDIIAPTCLQKQLDVFLDPKNSDVVLVFCNGIVIDKHEKPIMNSRFRPLPKGISKGEKAIQKCLFFGTNIMGEPNTGLFRRDAAKNIRYDCSNPYMLDMDFWAKILEKGDLYYLPEKLAAFRVSDKALTSKLKDEQAEMFYQFAKKMYDEDHFRISYPLLLWSNLAAKLIQKGRGLFLNKNGNS